MTVPKELRTRLVLGPLMLALVGTVYWLDWNETLGLRRGSLSAAVLGLLAVAGVHEYVTMLRHGGFPVARWMLMVATVALAVAAFPFAWGELDRELYPLVITTLALLFPLALRSLTRGNMNRGLEAQGATMLGLIFVAWPLYLAQGICFRHLPSLLYVVLVCKGGDIGGYLVGVAFGRHKLIPHVSPGKTTEGALGSLTFSLVLAALLRAPLLEPEVSFGLTAALGIGIMLNVTTQTGDLIESLLKRRCGVKDSSALLPAHGGVLDLLDSLLFSFSAYFLVLVWLTGPAA